MPIKAMSLRLPGDLAEELAVVAETDEMPMSEVVREAISKHIADRRKDKNLSGAGRATLQGPA